MKQNIITCAERLEMCMEYIRRLNSTIAEDREQFPHCMEGDTSELYIDCCRRAEEETGKINREVSILYSELNSGII